MKKDRKLLRQVCEFYDGGPQRRRNGMIDAMCLDEGRNLHYDLQGIS